MILKWLRRRRRPPERRDRFTEYLLNLRPRTDPIKWCRPIGVCGPGLFGDKGCGHVVAPFYMSRGLADRAICGVCGRPFLFAFWKLNGLHDYEPSAGEVADIRSLYADLQRMARGLEPKYDTSLEERARLHCFRCRHGLDCDGLTSSATLS